MKAFDTVFTGGEQDISVHVRGAGTQVDGEADRGR